MNVYGEKIALGSFRFKGNRAKTTKVIMSWDTTIVTKYFSNKLDVDHRNYLATFHLPGLNGEYAIYPPQAAFWSQVLVVCMSCVATVNEAKSGLEYISR